MTEPCRHPASQPGPRALDTEDRRDKIFNGDRSAYELIIPGVWLSGDIDASYSIDRQQWCVSTTLPLGATVQKFEGTGATVEQATLAMIAVRLGHADPGPLIAAAASWRHAAGEPGQDQTADLIAAIDTYLDRETTW